MNRMDDESRITCTACQTEIVGIEQRRIHYRSDVHLVNLKRKVSGLGPLSEIEFQERLAILEEKKRQEAEALNTNKRSNRQKTVCDVCHKTFSSRQAFLNHERSKRHIDTLNKNDSVSEISSTFTTESLTSNTNNEGENNINKSNEQWIWVDEDNENDQVDSELKRRLSWDEQNSERTSPFDDHICDSSQDTLQYILKHNGFFIPYAEYLIDPPGLVKYLCQKVCVGYACIACDKGFGSIEDVRRHMLDRGHQRMANEENLFSEEYDEFYDWSKSTNHDAPKENDEEEPEAWTEITADDEQKLIEQTSNSKDLIVYDENEQIINGKPIGRLDLGANNDDDSSSNNNVDDVVYGLALGSKVVGHRSLLRYYKQSGGTQLDTRDSIVANRSASEMRVAAWRAERKKMNKVQAKGQAFAKRRQQYFELSVGSANYYVRKSKLRQNMVVLNSGYRA